MSRVQGLRAHDVGALKLYGCGAVAGKFGLRNEGSIGLGCRI